MMKFKCGIVVLMFISVWGCSNASNNTVILDASGKHPAGWAVASNGGNHPALYLSGPEKCQECHGADLKGGVSKVSCFSTNKNGITCHPMGPSNHPVGWSAPGSHGSAAKAATPGLSYCTGCHGTNFTGGSGKSCMTCHTTAPHPAAPWRGITATGTTHTTTNQANVAECARCHFNNQRLTVPQTVPAGVTPGCFNTTLCHGPRSGHPVGWSAPTSHGVAAKAAPSASQGFTFCTQCHGTDFVSGIGMSCKTCHSTAPHPVAPWRGTTASGTTHTTTNQGNVDQCARCHLNNQRLATPANVPAGTTPGCFNGTLCHGTPSSGHAFPYGGSLHRTAGATPSSCQRCHNITSTTGAYPVAVGTPPNCAGCHYRTLFVGCSDCHGSTTNNGQPNSTTFPNRAGRHGDHTAIMGACDYCHFGGGTGTSTHGNSNRVAKTVVNVKIAKNPARYTAADTITITQDPGTGAVTCSGSCHMGTLTRGHGDTW